MKMVTSLLRPTLPNAVCLLTALLVGTPFAAVGAPQQTECTQQDEFRSPFVPENYVLTFADEFADADVSRFNEAGKSSSSAAGASAWRSRNRHPRFTVVNKEKQIYVDRDFSGTAAAPLGINPFSLNQGCLEISATRLDPENSAALKNARYASGIITTENSFQQRYGYFEARLKLPAGKGFWPAFWMLPKKPIWPPEIDIMEGSGLRDDRYHVGVIVPDDTKKSKRQAKTKWLDVDTNLLDSFHVYGLLWTETGVTYYLDDKRLHYIPIDIKEEMFLILNLAVGSHDPNWIPDPDRTTVFPGKLIVDYVRAYRSQ